MRRFLVLSLTAFLTVFILPSLIHLGVWLVQDRPGSWREADWSSAGILAAPAVDEAAIYVMAARTGGLKGAFSVHSWLLVKKPGQARFDRYDVVGWGTPVRRNAYSPDARWYSNEPQIHHVITGDAARALIPKVEAAIAEYPWRNRGDYTIWPGPNSNTFVASVIRAVPELRVALPPTAVGRDYPAAGDWIERDGAGDLRLSLGGYAGVSVGPVTGFEINALGLVAGFDPARGILKVPSFGAVPLWGTASAAEAVKGDL